MLKLCEPEAGNFYFKREILESHDAYIIMNRQLTLVIAAVKRELRITPSGVFLV